jgi:molybdopterin converting factor small subunit
MIKSMRFVCIFAFAALCFAPTRAQAQDAPNVVQNDGQTVEEVYAKLSSLKMDERRKAFVAVDGKMKAKLWLLHFTLFELNRELTPEQVAFVAELKALVKGTDMDAQRDEIRAKLTGLRDRVIALFGEDEARRLVAEIGSERLAAVNK